MITPEAMREKLVEAMARAIWLSADPEEGAMEWWKEQARAALEAIEAQGLVILPVDVTDDLADAMLDTGLVEDGVPGKSAYECARIVYRAMILEGKLCPLTV